MLINRKTDYAVRILRVLRDGQTHTIKDISRDELVPLKFAYKISGDLKKSGIITVTTGKKGGCKLAADLNAVTLFDLIGTVEGRQYINSCIEPGYRCEWVEKKGVDCVPNRHFREIQQKLDDVLKSQSVADLFICGFQGTCETDIEDCIQKPTDVGKKH